MDAPKGKCRTCSVIFKTRQDMLMRMDSQTHLKCQGCSATFTWKDLALIYKCSVCSKSYKTRSRYRKHALSHCKGDAYKCDFCAAAHRSDGALRAHLKRHADRNERKFDGYAKSTKRMMAYVKWHDEGLQFTYELLERPGKQFFRCGVCSDVFYTKELLQNHIFKSHIEENPSDAGGNLCLVQKAPQKAQGVKMESQSQETIVIDDSSDDEDLVTNDEEDLVMSDGHFVIDYDEYFIINDEEHFVTIDGNLYVDDTNGNEQSTTLPDNRENYILIEIIPGPEQLPDLAPKPPDNLVIKLEDEAEPDERVRQSGDLNKFFFNVLQQMKDEDQLKLEGGDDEDIASSVSSNSSYIKEEPYDIEETKIVFASS